MNDETKEFNGRIAFSTSIDIPEEFDKHFIIGEFDNVNKPNHYQGSKGLESIEVIDNFIGDLPGKAAWCWGNAIKYLLRFQKKNGLEDLKKARKNLDWLIEEMEHEN